MNHGFPLNEARGRGFDRGSGFAVWAEPLRPFFAGIFGVSRAYIEFKARLIGTACSCAVCRRRAPPFDSSPLRKKLCVKRARFVGSFCFVLRPERDELSGVGCTQNNFSRRIACYACDL